MKKLLYIICAISFLYVAASCGKGNDKATHHSSDSEIEAAVLEGRNAAKEFVTQEWKDTMQLQSLLLKARAAQSKYEMADQTDCAAAYDSAFVSTLRTVRPDIADQLQ